MLTHFNVIHSCLHYKNAFNLTSNDHSILVVPASHVTGIVAHFLLMIFINLDGMKWQSLFLLKWEHL